MQIESLPDLGFITAILNDPVRLGLVLSAVAALAAVLALVFVLRQGAARARELSHLRLLAEQALAGTRAEAETTRAELRGAGTATIERLVGLGGTFNTGIEQVRTPLSREKLAQLSRGREFEPFDRSLDVQVSRLRKLIETDPSNPRMIQTVWGVGYVFIPEEVV